MPDRPSIGVDDAQLQVYSADGPVPRTYDSEQTLSESVTFSETDGDPLQTFPNDAIESIDISAREGREVGVADIVLRKPGLAVGELVKGRQLVLDVDSERTDGLHRLARLRLGDFSVTGGPGPSIADLEAENWVFATLAGRRFTGRIRDEPLDEAVQRILDAEAPDIVLDNNLSSPPVVSETFDAVPLREAIARLLDNQAMMAADDNRLRLQDVPSRSGTTTFRESRTFSSTAVFDGEASGADLIEPQREIGGDLVTRVRVDGGSLAVPLPSAARPTRDEYQTVDTDSRLITQLDAFESEIDSVELPTRHSSSESNLIVRLHPNEDGQPANPDNVDRDLATTRLNGQFVDENGLTTVEFAEHTISEAQPYLIIELEATAASPTPIEIGGTTADGSFAISTPTVNARRSIVLAVDDEDAQDRHGRHDKRIQRDSIASLDEAERVGNRILSRRNSPGEEIEGRANAASMYDLSVLDVQRVAFDDLAVDDEFVVTEIEEEIVGTRLLRTLTFRQPAGF